MKKIIALIFCLSLSLIGKTQDLVTVSGTVTDSDSITWTNGTWQAQLINPRGGQVTFIDTGIPLTPSQTVFPNATLGSGGSFSVSTLPNNAALAPAGTQWQFTFCPNASVKVCSTLQNLTITQNTVLTSTITSQITAPRFVANGANAYGYADIEVNPPQPLPGGSYFNVTQLLYRFWNGTTWNSQGSGGVPGTPNGSIQYNCSGSFCGANLAYLGSQLQSPTDGSYVINNFTYVPYASGFGNNVFLGTGTMAWGTGTAGGLTGFNIAIGPGALASSVKTGSSVAVGASACGQITGNNTTDPFDGNDTCVGADAGFGDATMYDSILIGQKAYTDITPGSTGGMGGSIVIGVHTDGIDGWSESTVVGDYVAKFTQGNAGANELPITGQHNTILGSNNVNCDFATPCVATGAQSMNWNTVVGSENLFDQIDGYNSQYAIILGSNNAGKYNAGTFAGGQADSIIAIGNNNLASDITAVDNVAIGNAILDFATSANNTCVGAAGTCGAVSTGNATAVGFKADFLDQVDNVTAFGTFAASQAVADVDAFGLQSCFNATGIHNLCIGNRAGANVGAGTGNAYLGYNAGMSDQSSHNTALGYGALNTFGGVTTGGSNTCVGSLCLNAANTTVANTTAIGANSTCGGCSNSELLGANSEISGTISGAAQIGAGTNSVANSLQFQGVNFLNSSGTLTVTVVNIAGITWSVGSGAPSGSCITGSIYSNSAGGSGSSIYGCRSGAWVDML